MDEYEIKELQINFETKLEFLRRSKLKSVKAMLKQYDYFTYKIFEETFYNKKEIDELEDIIIEHEEMIKERDETIEALEYRLSQAEASG